MAKIYQNANIRTALLLTICIVLDCDISYICEVEKNSGEWK
ncbi:hypothetical protein H5991_05715 [Ligilactobacillus agilis]|nr:hypothetical protein [Ligilactobacillus agilis]